MPIPGFRKAGEPRFYAVNRDDHLPHYRRCKINIALAEQRRLDRERKSAPKKPRPAKRAAPPATEGVQLDAFDNP